MKTLLLTMCLVAASAASAQTYSTNFPLTESPISEGGKWINGRVVGKDWTDVKTANGRASGLQVPPSNVQDNTALLAGNWGPDQTVEVTVYNAFTSGSYPEMEVRLRSSLAANSCSGYEILYSVAENGIAIVRWNGPVNDYEILAEAEHPVITTGSVLKGSVIGNVITLYINGTQKMRVTDNVYKTGKPGIGFDQAGGCNNNEWGFTSFTVTATGATWVVTYESTYHGVDTRLPARATAITGDLFTASGRSVSGESFLATSSAHLPIVKQTQLRSLVIIPSIYRK